MYCLIGGIGALMNDAGEEQSIKAGDFALINPDSWDRYIGGLKEHGLRGIRLVTSDDQPGIYPAIKKHYPGVHLRAFFGNLRGISGLSA